MVGGDHSPQRIGDRPPSVGKGEVRFFAREAQANTPVICRGGVAPPHDCWKPRPLAFFKPHTHRRMADIPP